MGQRLGLISCLGMALTVLPSCQSRRGDIAIIPRTTSPGLSAAERAGAEAAAGKYGVQVRWNAPPGQHDIQLQIAFLDRAVEERCKGVIIWPDEPSALMVPVERAADAGLATVVIGAALSLPPQRNVSYILNDEEMMGRMAAERIGEVLRGRGEVAVVGVDPRSLSSLGLLGSLVTVLAQRFPAISIVDRRAAANNDLDAELVVNEVLRAHSQVNAIICLDSIATVGAYLALKNRELTSRIKVIAVEQTPEIVNAVRVGQIDSVLAENAYEMGYRAVQAFAIGPAKGPDRIKLPPMLITAQNIESAAAKPFVAIDWRSSER